MKLIPKLVQISKLPFLLFLIINQLFSPELLSLEKNKEDKIKQESTYKIENTEYIIDSGDVISINFKGLKSFSNYYSVNTNGEIILPEIDNYFVKGLTAKELESNLNNLYLKTIIDPEIKVYIYKKRPVTIYLSGEIRRPGLYTLDFSQVDEPTKYDLSEGSIITSSEGKINSMTTLKEPTVFDALKKGNGITKYADLSSIRIIRNNSQSNGGGKIKAYVNILDLLESGDQSQNITLRDGDSIHVNKSEKIIRDQLVKINKTNLTPDSIIVYLNGNIMKAGRTILPQGTTLYEAIASAGGKRPYTGMIEYLKVDDFGNSEKKIIRYSPTTETNKKFNPLLTDGDIIIVRRNILGKTTGLMKEISTPIFTGLGLYSIFDNN